MIFLMNRKAPVREKNARVAGLTSHKEPNFRKHDFRFRKATAWILVCFTDTGLGFIFFISAVSHIGDINVVMTQWFLRNLYIVILVTYNTYSMRKSENCDKHPPILYALTVH